MFRKLFAFLLFTATTGIVVNAQQTPTAPTAPIERKVQSIVLNAPFGKSYLGVQAIEISKENFSKFGLSSVRGVGIGKVAENSPAANAGLQDNDVIVRFNGETVESVAKLNRLISEVAPDHSAKLTVLRGGSERDFNVVIGKRDVAPMQDGEALGQLYGLPGIPEFRNFPPMKDFPPTSSDNKDIFLWRGDATRQIGVGVTALTKQLGSYFGAAEGKGLLVNSVREDSPAAKAGLKAGDVIVQVEGKEISEMSDLIRAVNEKKDGDVSVTIIRDKNRQTIRVTPEISKEKTMRFEDFQKLSDPESN